MEIRCASSPTIDEVVEIRHDASSTIDEVVETLHALSSTIDEVVETLYALSSTIDDLLLIPFRILDSELHPLVLISSIHSDHIGSDQDSSIPFSCLMVK